MSKITDYLNNVKGIKTFLTGFSIPLGFYGFLLLIRLLFDYNSKFDPQYLMIHGYTTGLTVYLFIQSKTTKVSLIISCIITIIISVVLKVVYNIGGL